MMKCLIVLAFVAVCQGSVLTRETRDVENVPAPSVIGLYAIDPPGFRMVWKPVENKDASDPVLGYKVKIWEQTNKKVYKYTTVNGVKELFEETVLANFPISEEIPDFEPKEVITTKADETSITYNKMQLGLTYEARVQAFTKKGDGILSRPMRIQLGAAKESEHLKDMYVVS